MKTTFAFLIALALVACTSSKPVKTKDTTATTSPAKTLAAPTYEHQWGTWKDSTLVLTNNGIKYGFLDHGKEILPCEYMINDIPFDGGPYYDRQSKFTARKDGNWVLIDVFGKSYLPKAGYIGECYEKKKHHWYVQMDGKIQSYNDELVAQKTYAYPYLHGTVSDELLVVSENGKDFQLVNPATGSLFTGDATVYGPSVVFVNGKYGIYNWSTKNMSIPTEYDRLSYYNAEYHLFKGTAETSIARENLK